VTVWASFPKVEPADVGTEEEEAVEMGARVFRKTPTTPDLELVVESEAVLSALALSSSSSFSRNSRSLAAVVALSLHRSS